MADLETLLVKTSRTFALAIPMLPEPTAGEVGVAYLLLRIADTFEDATRWQAARRKAALAVFRRLLRPEHAAEAGEHAARWCDDPPVEHAGYVDLLRETPAVLHALEGLGERAGSIVRHHVDRTAEGMIRYAGRDGALELETKRELRDYCYVVAGLVGDMLTQLILLDRPALESQRAYLMERARFFGEGLQLTNILRDAAGDRREGRVYLPPATSRDEVFAIARDDLRRAEEYVDALARGHAPDGVLAFTALPLVMARETLDRIESDGPGAKLTRPEVGRLVAHLLTAIERGESILEPVGDGRADATP